jgi:hypothetical protein
MTKRQLLALLPIAVFVYGPGSAAKAQQQPLIAPGNLVVTVEGCGAHGGGCTAVSGGTGSGGYGDNQAAPITLFQYMPNGTASVAFVNSTVLPQTGSGANLPVSGEYGSSSEGAIQLSSTGQYLALMGYAINAPTFNAAYPPGFSHDPYGAAPSGALAQSGSLTGLSYTPIPRVIALIDANGNVNSSTPIYNIFNTNNPRSVFTANGSSAYVSGQGSGADATGGVFYIPSIGVPNLLPTPITGLDTTNGTTTFAQDSRIVQIYNNTLYVSVDTKEGTGFNHSFIGTLGAPPATSLYNGAAGPTQLTGFGTSMTGKLTITTGANSNGNSLNNTSSVNKINLSPVNYFFANATTLYVADSGDPKNDSNGDTDSSGSTNIGNGGLQKWVLSSGTWSLKYTLYQGLHLVNNGSASGTSGLYGLAGIVNGNGTVSLYATNYTLNDLDTTYLYGVTDTLSNTTPPGASLAFTVLDTAPPDSNFKGVSFAPSTPAGDVEITTTPSGLTFTASGAGCSAGTYTSPQTLAWTPGSNCILSVAAVQNADGVPYSFIHWENASFQSPRAIVAPSSTASSVYAYNATFSLVSSVPALTPWALAALGVMLAGLSAYLLRLRAA